MKTYLGLALSLAALPASGNPILSIPLPLTEESSIVPVEYSCTDGETLQVSYVNAGENRLAILPVDGVERVFVNVVSGSGARYVAGEYEWWSKGDNASLTDQLGDGDTQECKAQK